MRSLLTPFRYRRRLRSVCLLPGLLILSNAFAVSDGLAQTETVRPGAPAETAEVAQARAAFAEGIDLARQGRWTEALSALKRSDELRPHAITTYNIGYCERSLGRYTRARKMLAKALIDHKARGERELSADLITALQRYLEESERQIAKVTVSVSPETATVKVDGRPLEIVATDGPRPVVLAGTRDVGPAEIVPAKTFDVHIDPGTHEFVVSTKDQGDVATTQTFLPGAAVAIQLNGPETRRPKDTSTNLVEETGSPGHPNRTPAWIALGVGGVGAVVGTVSGAMAFAKKTSVEDACGLDPNSMNCNNKKQSGFLAADISTVAFIVAGVGAGVGVVLLLLTPGKKATSGATTAAPERGFVRPVVGLTSIGVEGRF
jgi:hypothetical protein